MQIGADIFKRALTYPSKLIAKNAGVIGSVVVEKVGILCIKCRNHGSEFTNSEPKMY